MISLSFAVLLGVAALVIYIIFNKRGSRAASTSSIASLPGPPSESFLLGNLRQFYQNQVGVADFEWIAKYGGVVRIKGVLGEDVLFVSDPKAVQHIYHGGYTYEKHVIRRELMRLTMGKGVLWADGDDHKRQRRVILPAFGAAETRALAPYFTESALLLCTRWKEIISAAQTTAQAPIVLDVTSWLSRATLDVIGQAAFDYQFNALSDRDNVLRRAFAGVPNKTFGQPSKTSIFFQQILQHLPIPVITYFFGRSAGFAPARELTRLAVGVSRELVEQKTRAYSDGEGGRDVMSLLVQANLNQKTGKGLTEEEMLSSMQTVMGAGHETTANSLSWTLFELAKHPHMQKKLRQEIWAVEKELKGAEFSPVNFEAMPYLQAVMKEILRFHPVSYYGNREATKDDVLPLSKPITSATDGRAIREVLVPKGTSVYISLAGYNRNEDIFGENPHAFVPERWLDGAVPRKGSTAVGVYGNLMTFGSGIRACVGWRFALLEFQTILVHLIKDFEFGVDPTLSSKLRRDGALIMLPMLEGEDEKGPQMPLYVALAKRGGDE